jgi:ATP-dependent Clp protease ATP-binding subunit ClpX
MLDIMYEIPSQPDILECVISEEVVTSKDAPLLLYEGSLESA